MTAWLRAFVLALVLLMPAAAPAHGLGYPRAVVAAYYAPVAVTWYPAYPAYCVIPSPPPFCLPVAPPVPVQRPLAVPTPAPPSGETVVPDRQFPSTKEPPLVREAHDYGRPESEKRYVAERRDGECCRVGFWNLTGRDLVLTIDGQTRTLPRNKAITLYLGREFVWQRAGSKARSERVPADRSTLEIVIR